MKPRVLIVDDSLTVRMDLQEAFESIGFATTIGETLAAARKALTQRSFSIVILDVLLPDGDGVELLREIKNTPIMATTPVVLLSTEAEVRDRVRGLKTGADEYVGKPYDRANVLARARQLVRIERPSSASALRLLLIDDSLTFRNEFKAVLESAGYSVITAENGEDGLRTAVAARPDAVIVNGLLPGSLDGAAVIRRLKDDITLRNTPCLLLTATESTGDELRTFEAGADAYVRKGTDTELILARIVALLRTLGPQVSEPAVGGLLGPKKILTVDDSPTYLHELAEELHKEGYDVIPARSGKEALALLEVEQVDCILLDLLMPELSGQETCRIIKKTPAWRNVPLLILTAVEETKAMVEGINAGADDYIPKSGDFEVLKARLRAQLRRKQFEDEYRTIREKLSQKEIEAAHAKAAQEIAEARASFEPLLRNEAWLNHVVRIAHLGAWDWDLSKNTQSWSDEQFRIFGLEPGAVEPSYDKFLQALHAEDRQRLAEAVKQALAKEPRFQIDCRVIWPDGELRHAVCQGEIYRNEANETVRIIGTVLDITERKRAEEQLRKASLYTRALIEASPDPLVTINRDGKITDVNYATELATGLAREKLVGSDFSNYFTDPGQARRGYEAVFTDGRVRDYPLAIRHSSGKTMDVLYNATLFKNAAGEVDGVFAAARDVTERKRAEEQVRQLNSELEQRVFQRTAQLEAANKELEAFSYSVSHDLRAPLRAINGFTRILLDEHKRELSPEAQRCLDQVSESGAHMGNLIDDLLAFSRLGRQDLNKKLVRIDEIVQVALEDLRADREGRQVEFILGSFPACETDPALLRQVFVNLLSNALKFTRLREKARIEIGTLTAEDRRRLADTRPNGCPTDLNPNVPIFYVRDNGVGFDMRYADKLFGVFQRLHKKSQFEGTGVGLATVQRIIQRQGGHVWADAEMNKGASFYFTLEASATRTSDPVCVTIA
jgi:PAS domain S-box-containing protein